MPPLRACSTLGLAVRHDRPADVAAGRRVLLPALPARGEVSAGDRQQAGARVEAGTLKNEC